MLKKLILFNYSIQYIRVAMAARNRNDSCKSIEITPPALIKQILHLPLHNIQLFDCQQILVEKSCRKIIESEYAGLRASGSSGKETAPNISSASRKPHRPRDRCTVSARSRTPEAPAAEGKRKGGGANRHYCCKIEGPDS